MNIAGSILRLVRVPYDGPRTGTHLLLQLRTDEGLEGVSYVSFAGEGAWSAKALSVTVEALVPRLAGCDVLNTEAVSALLQGAEGPLAGLVHRAASLIDVALWDIRGKALGRPVWQLLGGFSNRVRVYGGWKLWWQLDADTVARNAAWFREQGFTALKFRLGGMGSASEAVERTRIIRAAAGPSMDLLADANQSWDMKQALAIGAALDECGLFYLEDPISHQDEAGLAHLARELRTPLAAGESYSGSAPFRRLLERRGLDLVMVDLNVGGLTPWMKIAHLAETYGRPIVSHLCPEILAHAVAASPNGLILEYLPWASDLWREPPLVKDGWLELSAKPGLGLEVDEAAVKRLELSA